MFYTFDTYIAERYGVEEAIMINNLQFWINKNKANDKHFYDGNYWTYNTIKAFQELFSFWSEKQIRRILQSLIEQKVIKKGNYNNSSYDRTLWYAFIDESIFLNNNIHLPKKENGKDQKGKYIDNTDINTDINTNTNIIMSPLKENEIIKESKKEKDLKFLCYAERLKNYVENKKNKSIDNKTLTSWSCDFRLLFEEISKIRGEEQSRKDIEKAFDYLEKENDKNGLYAFVVESGKSFRDKFIKIEDKSKRCFMPTQNKPIVNYAEQAKYIL